MKKRVISLMIASASFFVTVGAANAAGTTALLEAQQLESQEKYAMAAAAYMAIMDGVDFVPGQKPLKLSKTEKIILGKCAVSCLEQGLERYSSEGMQSLSDCPELPLLWSITRTLSVLEPQNSRWTSLNAQVADLLARK